MAGDDPPSVAHHRGGFLHTNEERLGLRIDGKVEHIERDGHRPFVKCGDLRPGVIHEDVQGSELRFDARKHAANFFRLANVSL